MKIVWDEPKRLSNLDKHGLDFAAITIEFFEGSTIVRGKGGRLVAVGLLDKPITVVFAELGSEAVSVVSMRPASDRERKLL